jgi:hypothetical protein
VVLTGPGGRLLLVLLLLLLLLLLLPCDANMRVIRLNGH